MKKFKEANPSQYLTIARGSLLLQNPHSVSLEEVFGVMGRAIFARSLVLIASTSGNITFIFLECKLRTRLAFFSISFAVASESVTGLLVFASKYWLFIYSSVIGHMF